MLWSYGKRQSPLGLSLASAINYWLYDLEPGAKSLWASISSSVKCGVTFVGVTDVKCLDSPFPASVLSISLAGLYPPHSILSHFALALFHPQAAWWGGHGPPSFLLWVTCVPLLPGHLHPIWHSPNPPVPISILACPPCFPPCFPPMYSQNLEGKHCVLFSSSFPLFHILSGT